jgi:hypothetical protein
MDIQDISGVVVERLTRQTRDDVKTVHFGEADEQDVEVAMSDPQAFARMAGVETGDESQYRITLVQRQDRHSSTREETATVKKRRTIIIVMHYSCCCGEILIIR